MYYIKDYQKLEYQNIYNKNMARDKLENYNLKSRTSILSSD